MKRFIFLTCLLLAGLVRADVPAVSPVSNPPDGQFFIITYPTGDYYAVLDSSWMDYIITFSFDSYEEANIAADLVRGTFSSIGKILGVLPIRSGSSDVLEWRLFLDSGCQIGQWDVITFFSENSISYTSSDWLSYSEGNLVEYGELDPFVPVASDVLSEDEREFFSLLFSSKIEELNVFFQSALLAKRSLFEEFSVIREKVFYLMVVVFFLLGSVFYIAFVQRGLK